MCFADYSTVIQGSTWKSLESNFTDSSHSTSNHRYPGKQRAFSSFLLLAVRTQASTLHVSHSRPLAGIVVIRQVAADRNYGLAYITGLKHRTQNELGANLPPIRAMVFSSRFDNYLMAWPLWVVTRTSNTSRKRKVINSHHHFCSQSVNMIFAVYEVKSFLKLLAVRKHHCVGDSTCLKLEACQ